MGKDNIVGVKTIVEADGEIMQAKDTVQTGRENAGFESDSGPSTRNTYGIKRVPKVAVDQNQDETPQQFKTQVVEDGQNLKKVPYSHLEFRKKVIYSVFLLWNITTVGWGYGQMGPVFPDLQDLSGVSLKQGSWLFTGFAVGYLAGCLLSGFIQSRFSPNFMLFLHTMVSAISFALLPWIPIFPVMVFLRALSGIGIGGQDTGVLSMLFAIWTTKVGPLNQMVHVLFAVGGILSPLATKPFLMKASSNHLSGVSNSTDSTISQTWTVTNIPEDKGTATPSINTNIHYALLISGVLYLSAAVPFLMAFKKESRVKTTHQNSDDKPSVAAEKKLPKHIVRIVLVIMFLTSFVATACTDLFPNFLTSFLIEQVGWSRQDGSDLTSLFFAMYAVGNFINIFVSIYVQVTQVVIFSYVCSIVMFTGILLSIVFRQTELIWATVSLSGAALSNIIPTIYTWTQEHVTPITAPVASGLLIFGSLGLSLNPLLVGYMMEMYTPMWFIYLSLGNIVVCTVLFISALIIKKLYDVGQNTQDEEGRDKDGQIDIYMNGHLQKGFEVTHL